MPTDGHWLPIVRRLMIPIQHLRSHNGYLQSLRLSYNVPLAVGEEPQTKSLSFSDVDELDLIFAAVETKYV
jgi:hypothetical protein